MGRGRISVTLYQAPLIPGGKYEGCLVRALHMAPEETMVAYHTTYGSGKLLILHWVSSDMTWSFVQGTGIVRGQSRCLSHPFGLYLVGVSMEPHCSL